MGAVPVIAGLMSWCGLLLPVSYGLTSKTLEMCYRTLTSKNHQISVRSPMTRIMICSGLSTVSFSAALSLAVVTLALQLSDQLDSSNDHSGNSYVEGCFTEPVKSLRWIMLTIMVCAYVGQLAVCFDRLMLVYTESLFELSTRTVRIYWGLVCWFLVCWLISLSLRGISGPLIGFVLFIPGLIGYPILSIWTVWRYFDSTWKLAKNDQSLHHNRDLIGIALKLSIITVVAILSSVMVEILAGMAVFSRNVTLYVIHDLVFVSDSVINIVCLVSAFQDGSGVYHAVFGNVHHNCMIRLVGYEPEIMGSQSSIGSTETTTEMTL